MALLVAQLPSCSFGTPIEREGCSPRPRLCGEVCSAPCCVPCTPGAASCADGVITQCLAEGCVAAVQSCSQVDACIGSGCAESAADCAAVRAAYEAEVSPTTNGLVVALVRSGSSLRGGEYGPGCPNDCAVEAGDCASGLDTCWLVGYRTSEAARLAELYARLGCPSLGACDCPPVDWQLSCRTISDDAGVHEACVTGASHASR